MYSVGIWNSVFSGYLRINADWRCIQLVSANIDCLTVYSVVIRKNIDCLIVQSIHLVSGNKGCLTVYSGSISGNKGCRQSFIGIYA